MPECNDVSRVIRRLRRRPLRALVRTTGGCVEASVVVTDAEVQTCPSLLVSVRAHPVENEPRFPIGDRKYTVELPMGLLLSPKGALGWILERVALDAPLPLREHEGGRCERCGQAVRTSFCPHCGEQARVVLDSRACVTHDVLSGAYCGHCGMAVSDPAIGSGRLARVD